jgi:two-component system, NarL family, nitrate/nitrite response regulator NarL
MVTNVLVCHRDGLVADAIRSVLTEQGFRVSLADTSDEIVERARTGGGACLIDMGMPGAIAAIRRVIALPSAPRVLALVNNDVQIAAAVEAGAGACMSSADGLDRLVHLLRTEIIPSPRVTAGVAQSEFNRIRANGRHPHLTAREIEVLAGLVRGESTKALAARLKVRPATARTHVQHLLAKLGVHSRLQAVAFVIENPIDSLFEWSASGTDGDVADELTAS